MCAVVNDAHHLPVLFVVNWNGHVGADGRACLFVLGALNSDDRVAHDCHVIHVHIGLRYDVFCNGTIDR